MFANTGLHCVGRVDLILILTILIVEAALGFLGKKRIGPGSSLGVVFISILIIVGVVIKLLKKGDQNE